MIDLLLKYRKISLPSCSWGFSFGKSWLVFSTDIRYGHVYNLFPYQNQGFLGEVRIFVIHKLLLPPRDSLAVPAKPELSICMVPCGSGFVWTSVLSHSSPEAVVAATSFVSLLLDRSMSSESWCLAGIHQSPCSSDFAALTITAHSLCSSWQQEHHLPRFSL